MWAANGATLLAVAAVTAFTPSTRTINDAKGDVTGSTMDLVRASLGRASNGDLRGSFTTADAFTVAQMAAKNGIPGTACLRLWTKTKPGGTPPDYLVCATAAKDRNSLDGSVLQERAGTTPVRVGPARVSRSSTHNITLRFSQAVIGRPRVIRFAVETVAPGCDNGACTDVAPENGRTAYFRLR